MKKIVLGLLVVILIALGIFRGFPMLINLYLNNNADKIVSNMITRTSTFGEHQVKFGGIRLDYNFFGTNLKIEDIEVNPSKELSDRHVKVNLRIDDLEISGFKWTPFLFSNSITVDSAKVENIKIISSSPPLDSLVAPGRRSSERKSGKDYDLIEVKFFGLNNLSIELENNLADSVRVQLENMGLTVQGFELSKEEMENRASLFKVDEIVGNIERAVFHFDDFRQFVEVKDIQLNSLDNSMDFGFLSLLNKVEKYAYTAQFEERHPFIEINNSQMQLKGVDVKEYLRIGKIEVDTIIANNLQFEVFIDKRKPENTSKRPKMFHKTIGELGKGIHVGHVFLDGAYIKIEERPDNNAPTSAFLYFSDLSAHISNISNFEGRIAENSMMVIDASAKLMGQGMLNAEIKTDLKDENRKFWLRGTLRGLDVTKLNTMVAPEARASLKSGRVDRLDFNIAGNDYEGTGELIVRYRDLELELLNRDFIRDENMFRKLGSFIANKVVIKSNNPDRRGNLKKGSVYAMREPHKSEFNYWWQLIFSGLKSTLTGDDIEEIKKKELAKRAG
jgi:hypothetical protein